ncbi:MAG: RidA family protein [Deltaproteobacteria bacterium]|nr:RidA family protein [Deltaproteobacteria bacterium]
MKHPASRSLEHAPVFSWHRGHGGLIYTSGHAAVDPDDLRRIRGTFEEETRYTLDALRRTLEEAGSSLEKVLKVTAYLVDMKHYPDFNRIYASYFPGENPPARTCVEVQRLPYDFQVEIEAVAHS